MSIPNAPGIPGLEDASYATTGNLDIFAFDQLPEALRHAVREAPLEIAAEPLLAAYQNYRAAGVSAAGASRYFVSKIEAEIREWMDELTDQLAA